MRVSTIAAVALLMFVPSAVPMAVAADQAPRFTPAAELQPNAIVNMLGRCRRLAIAAYHSGDTRELDAYVVELFRDQRARRDEILACGAYLVGASDAEFYLPDVE